MFKFLRNRKGQGLVEYALIIAGVTLVAAAGVTIFGHKVAGMMDMAARNPAWGSRRLQQPDCRWPVDRNAP